MAYDDNLCSSNISKDMKMLTRRPPAKSDALTMLMYRQQADSQMLP